MQRLSAARLQRACDKRGEGAGHAAGD